MRTLENCTVILVAISDGAIEDFVRRFKTEDAGRPTKKFIHFSGSLVTTEATGVHPLMTFSEGLYDLADYEAIHFVCDAGANFQTVFPRLPNRFHEIPTELKPLYHSFCVLSGNFTVLLWEKFFHELENKFGIPRIAAAPYLKRTYENLLLGNKNGVRDGVGEKSVLTGPLQRNDKNTVEKNLRALNDDAYGGVYRAFVEAYFGKTYLGEGDLKGAKGRNHEQHP